MLLFESVVILLIDNSFLKITACQISGNFKIIFTLYAVSCELPIIYIVFRVNFSAVCRFFRS